MDFEINCCNASTVNTNINIHDINIHDINMSTSTIGDTHLTMPTPTNSLIKPHRFHR